MKQIRFNLDNNFRLTLSSANQLFELENNSAELIFTTAVRTDMKYELHCENKTSKFYQELTKSDDSISCILTDAFLQPGSTKIQLKGIGPNNYIIESNQLSFSVKPFINARGVPSPSQQGEFEKLILEVKEVHEQVNRNTSSISGLNTVTSQMKQTIRDTEIRVDEVETDIVGINTSIGLLTKYKAEKTYVDEELAKKADKNSVNAKADKTYVDTELAKKANASAIPTKTSQLQNDSNFTTKTYVDTELAKKADISTVASKAEKTYVDTELAKKADTSTVSSKAEKTYVDDELAKKADKTYVDEELTKKQNKLTAGTNITIDPETNTISASGGGEGDVTKEYLEQNYYNKSSIDSNRDNYVKDGLVNNSNTLSDAEKLKIETWLGLPETYLTTYNETPYSVDSDYNPAHKKYVDDQIKEVELYKFPNVTIIGEPTINHGQISDFSSTSYLKFPFLVDFHNNAFEINMEFTTGSNVLNQENIFDSDFGLAFAVRQGKFVIAISTNGTSWNIGEGVGTHNVQARTTYYVRLSWNKLVYKLEYSFDNQTFATDISKTAATQPYPKQIYIGVGENFTEIMNHFSGIINLNNASLKIGTEIVWQGMDDAGLSTRADTSLDNIDSDGEQKIKDLASEVVNVDDVQINGTSILAEGVANIPKATNTSLGLVIGGGGQGVSGITKEGAISLNWAYDSAQVKDRNGTSVLRPSNIDALVRYAMCDGKGASWTEQEQAMAQERIGLGDIKESVEDLWLLNKGISYKVTNQLESGMNVAPKGMFAESLLDVRGKSEQKSTNGYQLLDVLTYGKQSYTEGGVTYTRQDDGSYIANGTATGNANGWIAGAYSNTVPLFTLPAGSYRGRDYAGIYSYDGTTRVNYGMTFTIDKPLNVTGILVTSYTAGQVVNNEHWYPYLESGTVLHDYEPYTGGIPSPNPDYPQPISSVEELNFKVTGKNLLNLRDFKQTKNGVTFEINNGVVHVYGTPNTTNNIFFTTLYDVVRVYKNCTYTYKDEQKTTSRKFEIFLGDDITNFKVEPCFTRLPQATKTFNSEGSLDCVPFILSGSDLSPIDITLYPQVELGAVATDFEPYRESTKQIIPPFALNGIGEYYDCADVDKGVWIEKFTSIKLGDLNWSYANGRFFNLGSSPVPNIKMVGANNEKFVGLCSDYVIASANDTYIGAIGVSLQANTSTLYIRDNSDNTDALVFKNKVANSILLYGVANESAEGISATDLDYLKSLQTLKDNSVITITDQNGKDISFLMEYIIKLSEVN